MGDALVRVTRSSPKATLAPEAVTKVEDAVQDANGFTWFVRVDDGEPFEVGEADMPEWSWGLPAAVCGA